MRARHTLAVLGVALVTARGAAAQQTLDRIVAVVGTRAILLSQVEEQLVQLRAQNIDVPTDSAARDSLRSVILDQMIDEQLIVQQAERDTTVQVTDQEVQDQVEQTYQNVRRQFATEVEFHSQLRMAGFASAEEWRRYLADQQRRTIMRQRLLESLRQQGKLRPIPPSDSAVRTFWESNRGQLPKRPPTVSFRQIAVVPQADSVALRRAHRLAESLAVELRRGADFAAVARQFSDDSITRESGGELGWFRRGTMVRNFDAVAFRLRPGQISEPVYTEYGFHIIKVERAQAAEVLARHILIIPDLSPQQIERYRGLADSIHAALAAGAPFDTLARRYSDPNEPRLAEDIPIDGLPPEYRQHLGERTDPGLLPVFLVGAETPRPRFVIFQLLERKGEGDVTFEDMRVRIRERLAGELGLQQFLKQLRRQTYVDVRL
jgi:peptidyl-prolyl cis-trans isomerase SurA